MNRKFTRRRAVGTAAALAGASLFSTAAAMPSGAYRIDLHAHFLPPEYRASLLSHGYFTIGGYPTPDWSPEAALDFMDRYGIAAQALSISDPGVSFLRGAEARDMARYCNTYAAGLFKSHPTRFGGFAVLPMPDVAASIAELEYALTVLKLDGVVLLSSYDGVYLGDPRFEPLMAALDRHNAYVFVHPASVSRDSKPELPLPDFLYEFTFDTTRAATMLMYTGTMRRYPRIRFQLAHMRRHDPLPDLPLGRALENRGRRFVPARRAAAVGVRCRRIGQDFLLRHRVEPGGDGYAQRARGRAAIPRRFRQRLAVLPVDPHRFRRSAARTRSDFHDQRPASDRASQQLARAPRLAQAVGS